MDQSDSQSARLEKCGGLYKTNETRLGKKSEPSGFIGGRITNGDTDIRERRLILWTGRQGPSHPSSPMEIFVFLRIGKLPVRRRITTLVHRFEPAVSREIK
jgi:hypothetical protein